MKILSLTIPLNPIPKKNSNRIARRRDGSRFLLPSERFEQYQNQCGFFLGRYRNASGYPLDGAMEISCTFYRETKHRVDLTNLLEGIDDILVHYGVIKDDSWKYIVSHDGSRIRFDKENPRTEITIRSIKNETD